ncbi:OPT family oligopeptide transporter [Thiocapsa marina]|uniref:Oligopeptide transporter, OPT superfamily n=1 Tax=Thiocapsa marina 5811 TaxID=768671 RepID=F9U6R9_9GAMM|nr:OPT family oligopeptide transporter [Thiocapsa marina]EGV19945.1 oligopeptide transporter, OPT superfamily [Thiocapsa marina 5811]
MSSRHLTVRALVTGVLLGILLTPCNIYSGLKIGWSFNVSIIALLIASGFWALLARFGLARTLGVGEGNIAQTTTSSSANIISGGLVAPIPALAMLSGSNLPPVQLVAWVFAVSFLGIWVAWYLRASLILRSGLAFPTGRATAETLMEIFNQGREAALKLRLLLATTFVAGTVKWLDGGWFSLPRPSLGFTLPAGGALSGYAGISAKNLTFTLDPSLMLAGFGAIIGFRAGVSLLIGALISWGVLGPLGLHMGFVTPGEFDPDASWFPTMVEWLLWPGVALMVASALTRFLLDGIASRRRGAGADATREGDGCRAARLIGLAVASALVVIAQTAIFDIGLGIAVLAVPIAFLLAMVASRVVGETGIPPIGAIGKVSQLGTGMIAPGEMTANLIGANVAGGAAGQSADLLNDFKAGHAIGAPPQLQVVAQFFGILTGSLVGSLVYLRLVPDPAGMLITEEWPAPAVATWKVVAETLSHGLGSIPSSALWAVAIAGAVGVAASVLEHRRGAAWLPSMPALGLAMVIPASLSITMFFGSLIASAVQRWNPNLAQRFSIAAASGLIAGESLAGVGRALLGVIG